MNQHLISTPARPDTCQRCGAEVLTAHDDGKPARVNATPLPDRDAEIAAIISGLRTFTLTRYRHLIYRDAELIARNESDGTIHAQHKCAGPKQLVLDLGGKA